MSAVRVIEVTTIPMTMKVFLAGQIGFLRGHGFEVIGVSSPGPETSAVGEHTGIKIIELPMVRGLSPVSDAFAILRLARILRRLRPDILHTHTPKASLVGTAAAFLARVPVRLYTIHGLIMESSRGKSRRLMAAVERLICRLATRVYAVSDSVRTIIVNEGICPADKISVLGHGTIDGIDADRFNPAAVDDVKVEELRARAGLPADAEVIGFIGRMVREKGVAELLEAFGELKKDRSRLHLLLVGPFESEDPLPPEAVAAIESGERIHHLEWVDDPRPAYRLMNVLALPTYREGFPYVPMEAAAMGLPVVASRVTGCVDAVVDEVTGVLVPARDAGALAGALRGVLDDPERARRLGRAGRERVLRDFAPGVIHRALLAEYRELLGKE